MRTGLAVFALLTACASTPTQSIAPSQSIGPRERSIETVQALLHAAADDHVLRVKEAYDNVAEIAPTTAMRARVNQAMLLNAQSTYRIAIGSNPVAGMVDLVTKVSLEREAMRRRILDPGLTSEQRRDPASFAVPDEEVEARMNEEQRILYRALVLSDRDMRRIADGVLWPEQLEELDALIAAWWKDNPARRLVANVRLQDFAGYRAATVRSSTGRSGSLFSLLRLDPLASLEPTTRELAQTRLLAERAFFQVQRSPFVLQMYVKDLLFDLIDIDEVRSLQEGLGRANANLTRSIDALERLPEDVRKERTAAIEQLEDWIARERETAVNQVSARVAIERDATLKQMEAWIAEERDATIEQVFEAVAVERKATLDQLEEVIGTQRAAAFDEIGEMVHDSTKEIQRAIAGQEDPMVAVAERVIDHVFRRAVQFLLIALGGWAVVYVVAKRLAR